MMMTQLGYMNTLDNTQWVDEIVDEVARTRVMLDYPIGTQFSNALTRLIMEKEPSMAEISRVKTIGYEDQRQRRRRSSWDL